VQLGPVLKKIQESPELPGLFLVILKGYDTPVSFLSNFYHQLSKRNEMKNEVTFIDTEIASLNDCMAQLEMSFLGTRRWYVLKNLSSLDAASKQEWYSYLENYQGPHTVFFYESLGALPRGNKAPKPKKSQWEDTETQLVIEIPALVDIPLYTELFKFFYPAVGPEQLFIRALFLKQQRLTLDDACRMMSYQTVVGQRCEPFFDQWYTKLVLSEVSLFTLSQYFFGRNTKLFLKQWKACKDDFPSEFWLVYWSEQLWQAAQFILRVQAYGLQEAKKGVFKLPFSFLQGDWQRHSLQRLTAAHDALYTLDYTLKNSGGEYAGL
jgi:hypothetical protein